MPRSARATVSRPGPDPTSSVGPEQRATSEASPGRARSQFATGNGVRVPSACSISGACPPGERVLVEFADHLVTSSDVC